MNDTTQTIAEFGKTLVSSILFGDFANKNLDVDNYNIFESNLNYFIHSLNYNPPAVKKETTVGSAIKAGKVYRSKLKEAVDKKEDELQAVLESEGTVRNVIIELNMGCVKKALSEYGFSLPEKNTVKFTTCMESARRLMDAYYKGYLEGKI